MHAVSVRGVLFRSAESDRHAFLSASPRVERLPFIGRSGIPDCAKAFLAGADRRGVAGEGR